MGLFHFLDCEQRLRQLFLLLIACSMGHVNENTQTPINAAIISTISIGILCLIYVGNTTAFFAISNTTTVFAYTSFRKSRRCPKSVVEKSNVRSDPSLPCDHLWKGQAQYSRIRHGQIRNSRLLHILHCWEFLLCRPLFSDLSPGHS